MTYLDASESEGAWVVVAVIVSIVVIFFFLFWWLATTEIRDELKEWRKEDKKRHEELVDILKERDKPE